MAPGKYPIGVGKKHVWIEMSSLEMKIGRFCVHITINIWQNADIYIVN